MKSLAAAFDQLASDIRYKRVDMSTARVMMSALDRELRCAELELRYGPQVVNKLWS